MAVRSLVLVLALASAVAPHALAPRGCNQDNCLRAFQDSTDSAAASSFCTQFLATSVPPTATTALPTYLTNCGTQTVVQRVSSACSCFVGPITSSSTTSSSSSSSKSSSSSSTASSTCPAPVTVTSSVTITASTTCPSRSTSTVTVSVTVTPSASTVIITTPSIVISSVTVFSTVTQTTTDTLTDTLTVSSLSTEVEISTEIEVSTEIEISTTTLPPTTVTVTPSLTSSTTSSSTGVCPTDNVLVNPSFETGDLTGWFINNNGGSNIFGSTDWYGVTCDLPQVYAEEGSCGFYAGFSSFTESWNIVLQQFFTTCETGYWTLSWWYKATNGCQLSVGLNGIVANTFGSTANNGELWTFGSWNFDFVNQPPDVTQVTIFLTAESTLIDTACEVYIDNVLWVPA